MEQIKFTWDLLTKDWSVEFLLLSIINVFISKISPYSSHVGFCVSSE